MLTRFLVFLEPTGKLPTATNSYPVQIIITIFVLLRLSELSMHNDEMPFVSYSPRLLRFKDVISLPTDNFDQLEEDSPQYHTMYPVSIS